MEKNLKIRLMKHIQKINEDHGDSWNKLDEAEKLVFTTADVIEFFRTEVFYQYQDELTAKEFEYVWHYLLGSVEMKDNDPLKYETSKD